MDRIQKIVWGLMGIILCGQVLAADTLSPEQVVAILKAHGDRITSIQAVMDVHGRHTAGQGQPMPTPQEYQTVVEYRRWARRVYSQVTWLKSTAEGKLVPERRQTIVLDQQDGKLLREEPIGYEFSRGQRAKASDLRHQLSFTPDMILDCIRNSGWDSVDRQIKKARVSTETDTGFHVLDYPESDHEKSLLCRIWINPTKEYFPVRREMLRSDQTVFMREECRNFKHVAGLWIPMEFIYQAPDAGYTSTVIFRQFRINEPVALDRLDFEFPDKTIMQDDLTGSHYMIARKLSQSVNGGESGMTGKATPVGNLPAPATDDALVAAAEKAEQMLSKMSPAKPASVTFLRSYVWVLPGKNDYVLELGPETKSKPALSGKTISDSPLVLHGVDDQLATSGKLIVTLERPEGHKAFADAVLTLDFGGTKTPIHFVAAPLP